VLQIAIDDDSHDVFIPLGIQNLNNKEKMTGTLVIVHVVK